MSTVKYGPEGNDTDMNDREGSALAGDVVHDVPRRGGLVVFVVQLKVMTSRTMKARENRDAIQKVQCGYAGHDKKIYCFARAGDVTHDVPRRDGFVVFVVQLEIVTSKKMRARENRDAIQERAMWIHRAR